MPTHTGKLAFSHLLCLVKMGSLRGEKKVGGKLKVSLI